MTNVQSILRSNYNRLDALSSGVFFPEGTIMIDNGAVIVPQEIPLKFTEGTDLKLVASSNGTAAVSIAMRGYVETVH